MREWLDVLKDAGVVVWLLGGGGKPSSCYLMQSGDFARETVIAALAGRPVWRPAVAGASSGSSGLSSGLSSGQHNADSTGPSGLAGTLPVSLPVARPYTTSSSSSSSSSRLPEASPVPEEDQDETGSHTSRDPALFPGPDCGLTLFGRLARIGVAADARVLDALGVAPPEIVEATLWRVYQHRGGSPRYVLRTLDSVQTVALAQRIPLRVTDAAPSAPEPAPEPADEVEAALEDDWIEAEAGLLLDAFEAALSDPWDEGGA